jgi:carbon-monoxide dehydrogenase iron sulfur subunit
MKLKLDSIKCTGCKICELACSAKRQGVFNPLKSHLKIVAANNETGGEKRLKSCTSCLSCVSICPSEAISFNGKWLMVDRKSCSGCGVCVDICPENIICLDNDGIAAVPNFCEGHPSCVEWCPHQSLYIEEGTA